MQHLPHIVKVESVACSAINPVSLLTIDKCSLPNNVNFTDLNIKEQAEAKVVSEVENGVTLFTTTLSFQTCHYQDWMDRRCAFRLTCADGKRYLMGTHMRPYPTIKQELPFPKGSDSSLRTVTVTLKSEYPLLQIL